MIRFIALANYALGGRTFKLKKSKKGGSVLKCEGDKVRIDLPLGDLKEMRDLAIDKSLQDMFPCDDEVFEITVGDDRFEVFNDDYITVYYSVDVGDLELWEECENVLSLKPLLADKRRWMESLGSLFYPSK